MLQIVKQACEHAGGPDKLAAALKCTRQALYQWPKVPAERVLQIEKATEGKTTRSEMRPDLYPPEESIQGSTVGADAA